MITTKNLTMSYGPILALDAVSFSVKEREIVGLLGPNGAGKTTLMRILTTFLYPTKGTATVGGFDITRDPLSARKIIGYLPETPPLYMDMRVDEFMGFVGRSRGIRGPELKKRLDWVIDATKIAGVWKHMICELSLGYRQRVGLAQALVHDPQVVILDEPTSGLDPMQIVGIRQLIKELAKAKTIIFSTHILQEVSAVADRIVIIDRGRIIANNTPDELRKSKDKDCAVYVTFHAPADEALAALKPVPGVKDIRVVRESGGDVRFLCTAESFAEVGISVNQIVRQKGWAVKELAVKEVSLEDVFLSLFKTAEK